MILGTATVIYVVFMTIIGIRTALKYFKVKDRVYIYAGLVFIALGSPWWGVVVSIISVVFFDVVISGRLFFLISYSTLPISHSMLVLMIMRLYDITPKAKKRIKIFYITLWLFLGVLYLTFFFTNFVLLGYMINEIQPYHGPYNQIYNLISLLGFLILFGSLGIHYWKSDNQRIRVKGELIFGSNMIFLVACIIEIFIPIISLLVLARFLVMSFASIFYMGIVLPKWAEKLFLKE